MFATVLRCSTRSPAGFHDAWNLALQRKRTEAQTAYSELSQEGTRPAAELAPIVLAGLEFRLLCIFHTFCGRCHNLFLSLRTDAEESKCEAR